MLLTGKHRIKLIIFLVIAAVSVLYAGINYAGLDRLLGSRGYEVTVRLASSGGLFVNSEVTYRGVAVGEVAALELTDDGVEATLDVSEGAPKIPADTDARVANRSAVGEQYLDLLPRREGCPCLESGSVIEQHRTKLPLAPDTVLANLDKLVSSVNTQSLRTVVDESYEAFAGSGPELQRLLDAAGSLTETATVNLPQTKKLLADGRVVLDTQRDQSENLTELASGLRTIAGELRKADPALREVIHQTPRMSRQVQDLLAVSGTDLGIVIANLLTTAKVTAARTDAVEQLLVTLPVISAFTKSVAQPDGRGNLAFILNFFNPPSCTRGYETTNQRPASDTSEAPPNTEAYCAEPRGSVTAVRGAQNAPYGGQVAPPALPPSASSQEGRQASGGSGDKALPGLLDFTSGSAPSGIRGLLGLTE